VRTILAVVAVVTTLAASASDFVAPPQRAGESAWIELKHQRQERNLCVPTSASIVLSYFGDDVSPRELKALSERKSYDPEARFTDFTRMMFQDLIAGLERRGYRWRLESFENTDEGFWSGLRVTTESLDEHVPVIIATTTRRVGHAIVIAGYSRPLQTIYAVDPNIEAPGIRLIKFSELQAIWHSNVDRGLIVPARKPAPRSK
jgi:hypothetical protein